MHYATDIRIQKHTDDSIARRTPGIKQLAARYNTVCSSLQNHPHRQNHPNIGIPGALDLDQLFNTEANQEMWLETGLEDDNPIEPPRYLYDESVKSGISAMLVKDRAVEERHRLECELKLMTEWVRSSLCAVENAINLCTGKFCVYFSKNHWDLSCIASYFLCLSHRYPPGASIAEASGITHCSSIHMALSHSTIFCCH